MTVLITLREVGRVRCIGAFAVIRTRSTALAAFVRAIAQRAAS